MATISDALAVVRWLLVDILVVSVWVAFLTLAFLATGRPRPAFYLLLVGGIVAWVAVTTDRKG